MIFITTMSWHSGQQNITWGYLLFWMLKIWWNMKFQTACQF